MGLGPLPRGGAGGRVRRVERSRRLQPAHGAAVPLQRDEPRRPGDRSLTSRTAVAVTTRGGLLPPLIHVARRRFALRRLVPGDLLRAPSGEPAGAQVLSSRETRRWLGSGGRRSRCAARRPLRLGGGGCATRMSVAIVIVNAFVSPTRMSPSEPSSAVPMMLPSPSRNTAAALPCVMSTVPTFVTSPVTRNRLSRNASPEPNARRLSRDAFSRCRPCGREGRSLRRCPPIGAEAPRFRACGGHSAARPRLRRRRRAVPGRG